MNIDSAPAECDDSNDFDRIAPCYDSLASIGTLGAIRRAQRLHMTLLMQPRRVLIVGGGAGRFLLDLLRCRRRAGTLATLRVLYLERSVRMLELARRLLAREEPALGAAVEFRLGSACALCEPVESFDAIVTNFFFDLFSDRRALRIARHLSPMLAPRGVWLVVDWQLPTTRLRRRGARLLFAAMYAFFRVVSQVESDRPPDYTRLFTTLGFVAESQRAAYARLIRSTIWARPPN